MMIQENFDLSSYTTFHTPARARFFQEITQRNDLVHFVRDERLATYPRLVLGGGSNILFTKDFDGVVLLNNLKGITIIDSSDDYMIVECMSGESWHEFVMWSVEHHVQGLETLALIPGTVGAAPVQNIGAYGSEVKDTILSVEIFDYTTQTFRTLDQAACAFAYRTSIFKTPQARDWFIVAVRFRLYFHQKPKVHYPALIQELEHQGITEPTIQQVADAVIAVRTRKLPDPAKIGNAGSFFKNPYVSQDLFISLQQHYPDMPFFDEGEQGIKIPAGWLIEQCGWKGKREGAVGVHEQQALVLVNYGNATGAEIVALAQRISHDVQEKFALALEPEVRIL